MPGKYVPPHLRNRKKREPVEQKKPVSEVQNPSTDLSGSKKKKPEKITTIFGTLRLMHVDITNPVGEGIKALTENHLFGRAYLNTRNRQKDKAFVDMYWVTSKGGSTIEIGRPEDWASDVAQKVIDKEVNLVVLRCGREVVAHRISPQKKRYYSQNQSDDRMFVPLRRKKRGELKSLTRNLVASCQTARGVCDYQEDRYTFIKDFHKRNPKWSSQKADEFPFQTYAAVIDGHGGSMCAEEASKKLEHLIFKNMGA